MGSSLGSYEIARSGLYVNERGLFVTGHNIANASTPGYVRQQAMITTNHYETGYNKTGMYQIGLGADIQQTRQIRHIFLDNVYREESTTLGYWETRYKAFQDVEAVLGEPMGEGLQNVMNQFWDSWQELSKSPDSLTIRAVVRQRGEALTYHLNHLGAQLDTIQKNLDTEINDRIDELNQITSQIASMNVTIFYNEVTGDKANDFRDQRNVLVDKLKKLCNAEVTEMQDGQLTVTLGGQFLVYKAIATKIVTGHNAQQEILSVPMIEGTNMEAEFKSGIIKGLMDSRGYKYLTPGTPGGGKMVKSSNISITDLNRMLNDLVLNFMDQVNTIHKSGYILGTTNPPPAPPDGSDFFTVKYPTKLLSETNILTDIRINDLLKDEEYIVTSGTGNSGDNTIALKMANLRNMLTMNDGTGQLSFDGYYQAMIQAVGNSGSEARIISQNQDKLVQAADANRQAIAGVSMDEEMSTMMKFQFAYSAATRVLNVIDEMIEIVATRLGIVGR
jgi:flagellar hook-associated protein 1